MADKGIKVKDLARELGINSRALVDRCGAERRWLQNHVSKLPKVSNGTCAAGSSPTAMGPTGTVVAIEATRTVNRSLRRPARARIPTA